jgi:hypothetical protein
LAREVNQVVLALQFQDITNQKLQLVTTAWPHLAAKFAEFNSAANAALASEPMQFLHQSCRSEAGQLQAARHELEKAERAMRGGVQKVLSHLTEIDSQCLSMQEFAVLTSSCDGMVQVLVETIGEVRTMIAATVDSAAKAYEMLQPLGGLASDLTAIVRGMSAESHLIGLNAQVQAARAVQDRRGAGLEVLSARTSQISEETNAISEQAALQLDVLAAGLAQSVQGLGQLRADGLAQQTLMNQQGQSEEQQLHAFRDCVLETLREIGNSLDDIRKQAQRTLAAIQFTEFHQVTLPALQKPLLDMAVAAERWLESQGCSVAQSNLVEGLQRDYSMAS